MDWGAMSKNPLWELSKSPKGFQGLEGVATLRNLVVGRRGKPFQAEKAT